MKTTLCDLLGIDFPIIQAPISPIPGGSNLAAAASNAGGLGSIAASGHDPDNVRRLIRETRARTTKPFSANILLSFPYEEILDVCLEEELPAISFFYATYLIPSGKPVLQVREPYERLASWPNPSVFAGR